MSDNFEKLIRELLEKGFSITEVSILETGELAYGLDGFYKSGSVKLYENRNCICALARYNEVTNLDDYENHFDALVDLNYRWWKSSKERFDGWSSPDPKWLPYLLEKGLIKQKTITVYE